MRERGICKSDITRRLARSDASDDAVVLGHFVAPVHCWQNGAALGDFTTQGGTMEGWSNKQWMEEGLKEETGIHIPE